VTALRYAITLVNLLKIYTLRILHLSDFHFRSSKKLQHSELVRQLCLCLKNVEDIDMICFTGDLVHKGINVYDDAYSVLIDPILNQLNLTDKYVFYCQGNHDLNRSHEMDFVKLQFEEFKSNEDLETFVSKKNSREFLETLQNHKDFFKFQEGKAMKKLKLDELHSVFKREINGKKVGIASINSAWRCSDSKTDPGKIVFPNSVLESQIKGLEGADLSIMLMHHPTTDFATYNQSAIERAIYENFDILLGGHVHLKKQSAHIQNSSGIFCSISPSTISSRDNYSSTGFVILDIDIEISEVKVINYNYSKEESLFYKGRTYNFNIPQDEEKTKLNSLRVTLRKKLKIELELSNDLLLESEAEKEKNFLELYTKPVIKAYAYTSIKQKSPEQDRVNLERIINPESSFLILGKDKYGKTSILRKVQLELLANFEKYKTLPVFIDCDAPSAKIPDIETLVARYFEVNQKHAVELIQNYHLKILIDNYDPSDIELNDKLKNVFKKYPKANFLATRGETISRDYEVNISDGSHSILFLHPISRGEVRLLANNWNLPDTKKKDVLEKIGKVFRQLNIPLNFWTASLFIWIHQKYADVNLNNNVDLINLYIEGILERNTIAFDKKSKITFDDFKIFIANLAYFLLVKIEASHSCTYEELVGFISDYHAKNKKFVIEVEEMIDIIIQKGVIQKSGGVYSFKLKGVFEYFIAYHMLGDEDFRNNITKDEHFYLSFLNEIELYSGFNRNDSEFLKKIFEKTQEKYSATNLKYDAEGIADKILQSRMVEDFEITNSLERLAGSTIVLTEEEKDDVLSELQPIDIQNSEVERKKFYDAIEHNPENLEKLLLVLCRVYRNSNSNDEELLNRILDFILTCSCNLGFVLIDELNPDENEVDEKEDLRGQKLLNMLSTFVPTIVQAFLFDALAQNNLERIFEEKIESLKETNQENQFKLTLMYFLLIELNVEKHLGKVSQLLDLIEIGVLKQTILLKLYYYLAFKCTDNPTLETRIESELLVVHKSINPKMDIKAFQRNMSQIRKGNIAQKMVQTKLGS